MQLSLNLYYIAKYILYLLESKVHFDPSKLNLFKWVHLEFAFDYVKFFPIS